MGRGCPTAPGVQVWLGWKAEAPHSEPLTSRGEGVLSGPCLPLSAVRAPPPLPRRACPCGEVWGRQAGTQSKQPGSTLPGRWAPSPRHPSQVCGASGASWLGAGVGGAGFWGVDRPPWCGGCSSVQRRGDDRANSVLPSRLPGQRKPRLGCQAPGAQAGLQGVRFASRRSPRGSGGPFWPFGVCSHLPARLPRPFVLETSVRL